LHNETEDPNRGENEISVNTGENVSFVSDLSRIDLVEHCHLNERVEDYREMETRCFEDVYFGVENALNVH
jgi:hypothetical protein